MIHTQTILTPEPYPCEILPVVFGASSPTASTAKPSSSKEATSFAATSASGFSNHAPDHLRWSRWKEWGDGRGAWVSLDGKHIAGFGDEQGRWFPITDLSGYRAFKDKALAEPPTVPPPSPVAKALTFTWEQVKGRRGVYKDAAWLSEDSSRYASDGNYNVVCWSATLEPFTVTVKQDGPFVALPNETIPPHVAAKFPQPAPAVEQAPSASGEQLAKGEYLSQLRQQAEAWRAVAAALDKHFPKWNGWDGRCPREYAVGVIVNHIVTDAEHDKHTGIVCQIDTSERLDGSVTTDVWVRWIKPDGSPSDGLTRHAPAELTPTSKEPTRD